MLLDGACERQEARKGQCFGFEWCWFWSGGKKISRGRRKDGEVTCVVGADSSRLETRTETRDSNRDSSMMRQRNMVYFRSPLSRRPRGSKAWNARLGPGRPMQTGRELVNTEREQGLFRPETLGIGPAPAGLDAPPISPGHQDIPGTPCQPCGTLIGEGLELCWSCWLRLRQRQPLPPQRPPIPPQPIAGARP